MKKFNRAAIAVGLATGLSMGAASCELNHNSAQPARIEGATPAQQVNSIEEYLKAGVTFKSDVLVSDTKDTHKAVDSYYVAVQGEQGEAIANPIVLKVGGAVVGYVGRQSNTELEFISPVGAKFWEMNYTDTANPMLLNYPIGKIVSRTMQVTSEPVTRQEGFKVHGIPSAEIFEEVGFNDKSDMYGATTLPITPPQPGEYQTS